VGSEDVCRGETYSIFCDYLDPVSPRYAPAYASILVRDQVVLTDEDRRRMRAAETAEGGSPPPHGCCGGYSPMAFL
jgi:hypothetical protein